MNDPHSRTWMYNRIDPDNGFIRAEFAMGIEEFINFSIANPSTMDSNGRILCPCVRCGNLKFQTPDTTSGHLVKFGFVERYTTWIHHGENQRATSRDRSPDRRTTEAAGGSSSFVGIHDPYVEMLHNAMSREYQSPPNESVDVEEEPNDHDKLFFNMLAACDKMLSSSCQNVSQLGGVARLLNIKSEYNLSEKCFDALCEFIIDILPEDNNMVRNFYETKKLIAGLGLPYEKIDACVGGCILYWGSNASLTECPYCRESRYKEGTIANIPKKYMFYLPLKHRLKRLYQSTATAAHMTWHKSHTHDDESEMCHPCDAEAWKHFDATHPSFSSEARNVRLGLCTDGFQPFGGSGSQYSSWPVFLTPYNLPPNMCMKEETMFLTCIIPGPRSPKNRIDVYLQPLIHELIELWEVGVPTYDVSLKQNFNLRACLLWTISDLPALAMLSGWSTHGRLACPVCQEDIDSFWLENGRKHSWFDCHRRWLSDDHPFRKDTRNFKIGQIENRGPPLIRSSEQMFEDLESRGLKKVTEDGGEEHNAGVVGFDCGWRKRSIFWDIPYWKTNLVRHNLDVMHIEKNVFDNILYTVLDVTGKTKDNVKSRADLALICNRKSLERSRNGRYPKANYTLTRAQRTAMLEWVKGVSFPDGYVSNMARCVDTTKYRMFGMKSHDCHVFMQRLIPVAFREFLPKPIWEALTELSAYFRCLTNRTVNVHDLIQLEKDIVVIICKLERIFPPSFFDVMEHLPLHLPREARLT